jgi:hypothetical protein
LFRRFDFAIINSKKPLHIESLAIMVVHDFNVRITRRVDPPRLAVEAETKKEKEYS